ncbi:peptide/nickel transport system permease protein [Microbacterium testaceum]|uniref:ABC transporter permease n=1 Tax=Microbacterium TaxID=33882 RepID=UPI0027812F3E|nr:MULTISPECIES: ABC transporter permease [Microbacterium]MDQ1111602.1 peptide/nickel transport system permease protein [Microbacterium testaceum]MDR6097863.1 peptide/nickel transport system permease protein [Microbacterium sp. SORGH_AS_0454]
MSETVALVPDRREQSSDAFAATAVDRFDDAVVARGSGSTASPNRRIPAALRRPLVAASILWLAVVVIAALWPALLAPGDPLGGTPADNLQAPSLAHLFGTDQLGRDLYTRVVHGTALTVSAAAIAVAVGVVVGSLIGLVSGFVGGRTDAVLMRVADVLLAIPGLLLSLAIITALGFGTVNVAIAVGIASVASVARVLRSEVLRVRTAPYVEAARASGNGWIAVLLRHVLPNSIAPVVVLAVLEFGTAILAVSALSFLGYGAPPPAPEWGALVSGGRDYLRTAWWLTALPGLVIAVTVLAANRLSRGLDSEGRARR